MEIKFDWDPEKAEINLKKHNVSFEEAKTVFYDSNAKLIADPDHSEEEDRFIIVRARRFQPHLSSAEIAKS